MQQQAASATLPGLTATSALTTLNDLIFIDLWMNNWSAIILAALSLQNFGPIGSVVTEYRCSQLTDLKIMMMFWGAPVASISISCPSCSATEGVVRNGKSTADISAIAALIAVKHGNCGSLTPPLCPVHTRKLLIWPWMASDVAPVHTLWALASTRFYGLKTQAAVGNLAHTTGQWRHCLRGNGRTVGLRRR